MSGPHPPSHTSIDQRTNEHPYPSKPLPVSPGLTDGPGVNHDLIRVVPRALDGRAEARVGAHHALARLFLSLGGGGRVGRLSTKADNPSTNQNQPQNNNTACTHGPRSPPGRRAAARAAGAPPWSLPVVVENGGVNGRVSQRSVGGKRQSSTHHTPNPKTSSPPRSNPPRRGTSGPTPPKTPSPGPCAACPTPAPRGGSCPGT